MRAASRCRRAVDAGGKTGELPLNVIDDKLS
jgi:hypothetical protein